MKSKTVLMIPDLQIPFHHKDAFAFLKALKKKYKPDEVVCAGDELDNYCISKYDIDPDAMGAGDELKLSLKYLKELYKIFPKVKVCISNHMVRPIKKAFLAGLPQAFLKSYSEVIEAPKTWKWEKSWVIDNVRYEHGDNPGAGGLNAGRRHVEGNMMSTMIGHFHTQLETGTLTRENATFYWGVCGCLIDSDRYAFAYSKDSKKKPALGTILVIDGVPQIIPMKLNKKGRWNGKV